MLSTQIRQLEDAVGTELLRRTSRGVVLTPAGSAFLDAARETLASLERGVTAAAHAAASVAGRLAVGLSVAAAGKMRTQLLRAFAGAYPAVELELVTFDLTAPAAGLLDHRTDVALIRPPVDAPGIALEEVEDVLMRRTRLFIESSDSGASVTADVAAIMGRLLGWSRRRRAAETRRYLDLVRAEHFGLAVVASPMPGRALAAAR